MDELTLTLVRLLDEIREQPEEDTTRLVLADALEERGGPRIRWAEFIRVQITRLRTQGYVPRCITPAAAVPCPEPNCAACREMILLEEDRIGDGFLLSVADRAVAARLLSYEFGRGFLETVTARRDRASVDAALELLTRYPIANVHLAERDSENPLLMVSIQRRPDGCWALDIEYGIDASTAANTFSTRERALREVRDFLRLVAQ